MAENQTDEKVIPASDSARDGMKMQRTMFKILAWFLIVVGTPLIAFFGIGIPAVALGAFILWVVKKKMTDAHIEGVAQKV